MEAIRADPEARGEFLSNLKTFDSALYAGAMENSRDGVPTWKGIDKILGAKERIKEGQGAGHG